MNGNDWEQLPFPQDVSNPMPSQYQGSSDKPWFCEKYGFGSHLHEAIRVVKDWIKNP